MQAYPYFQQQGKHSLYCALHTANNILGSRQYDKEQMNNICYSINGDFINPHKHIFGGEYDANVLILALQMKDLVVDWHDRRKQVDIKSYGSEQFELLGFVVNKTLQQSFFNKLLSLSGRHWFCLKKEAAGYFLLDPKLEAPVFVGSDEQAQLKLNQMNKSGMEILVVRRALK